MDINKLLQIVLDEFNEQHGDKLYYIENDKLMYKDEGEPLSICPVGWIDDISVHRYGDFIGIDNDSPNEDNIYLTPTGPE